jgi:hypothetical protein
VLFQGEWKLNGAWIFEMWKEKKEGLSKEPLGAKTRCENKTKKQL